MFEGQFNRTGLPEASKSPDLQSFRWTDLVARLAATRDLREEFSRIESGFGAFGEARRESSEKGKDAVNHEASGHGKASELGVDDAAHDAVQGDRETE
jgi:hypothetical protein